MYDQAIPQIIADGAGGAVIAWQDYRASNNWNLYAQRIDEYGAPQWVTDGVLISNAYQSQVRLAMVADDTGGAIIAWTDSRNSDPLYVWDIYAQRVDGAGVVHWLPNGVPVCTAQGQQQETVAVSDGAGGAIIAWEDTRFPTSPVYAQRVNSLGVAQWTPDGIAPCTTNGSSGNPSIASDGTGGAIITWHQAYSSGDIQAQRVDSLGVLQWTPDGIVVCIAPNNQSNPIIAPDGTGGAFVVWEDLRDDGYYSDINAQRLNAAGEMQWPAEGVGVCTYAGVDQDNPTMVVLDSGDAIIAWEDNRGSLIYAQRVNGDGTVGDPVTAVGDAAAVATPVLLGNYPNPFNPATEIAFAVPASGARVTLAVHGIDGRLVRTLIPGLQLAGRQVAAWDGKDQRGRQVASGVYIVRLEVARTTQMHKITLLE